VLENAPSLENTMDKASIEKRAAQEAAEMAKAIISDLPPDHLDEFRARLNKLAADTDDLFRQVNAILVRTDQHPRLRLIHGGGGGRRGADPVKALNSGVMLPRLYPDTN